MFFCKIRNIEPESLKRHSQERAIALHHGLIVVRFLAADPVMYVHGSKRNLRILSLLDIGKDRKKSHRVATTRDPDKNRCFAKEIMGLHILFNLTDQFFHLKTSIFRRRGIRHRRFVEA